MVSTLESRLWGLVAFGFIGDIVTTIIGLRLGLTEANPLISETLGVIGVIGFIWVKFTALCIGIAVWMYVDDEEQQIAVPAAFALVWVSVTVFNSYMIYTAL